MTPARGPTAGAPRRTVFLLALLAAAATFAVFSPLLSADFINWDDPLLILDNLNFRGFSTEHLRWMFTTTLLCHYEPLTWLSWALDYKLWGLRPEGYHFTNVLLHALNAGFFFLLAGRLLRGADPRARWTGALAAAALFAYHPLRVESVAWVAERRDVLSGFFLLLALLAYLRFIDGGAGRTRWYGASLLLTLFSLLSKAAGMTLAPVLVVLDVFPLGRLSWDVRRWREPGAKKVLMEKIPFLLLGLGAAVMAGRAQIQSNAAPPLDAYAHLGARLIQAGYVLFFYLAKFFLPVRLAPAYGYPAGFPWGNPIFPIAAVLALGVTAWAAVRGKTRPALAAGWFCHGLLLAPVSGIFQSGPQMAADRYTYLPGMVWALLGGAAAVRYLPRLRPAARGLALAAGVLLAAVLAGATRVQCRHWRNAETLWTHAAAVLPESADAQSHWGSVLLQQGRTRDALDRFAHALEINPVHQPALLQAGESFAKAGLPDRAELLYREVLRLNPRFAEAHRRLGDLRLIRGDAAGAEDSYREAVRWRPNDGELWDRLGVARMRQERDDDARASFERALALGPRDPHAYNNLGILEERAGRPGAAVAFFDRALEINPEFAEAEFNAGNALELAKDWAGAAKRYRRALARRPDFEAARLRLEKALVMEAAVPPAGPSGRPGDRPRDESNEKY